MKTLRLMMILAACCATGTVWAAEPAPAKPAAPAASKPADESAAPKGDEQTQAQQGTKAVEGAPSAESQQAPVAKSNSSGKPSGKGGSPERFVPSEQVRADFDVSFPIDI